MAFGPGADSIILKLLESDFTPKQREDAAHAFVDIKDVAMVEIKLWIDFGEAIGELVIEDSCIEEGRCRYFRSVVKFLASRDSCEIREALKRSQICTTRAAAQVAEICAGVPCEEISVDHYRQGCDDTLHKLVAVMKKMKPKDKKTRNFVPLCEDAAKGLLKPSLSS